MKQSLVIPAIIALSVGFTVPAVSLRAQPAASPPQSEQDHSAHHPETAASVPGVSASPAPTPGMSREMMMAHPGGASMGGMMNGDMDRMMAMMHSEHGMMGGMPFEHVEGRLAFLKAELKIVPAQEPHWSKFADVVRSVAQSMKAMHGQMMQGSGMMAAGAQTATARFDRDEQMLTHRLDAVRTVKGAFAPLYASLSIEQKKMADQLVHGMNLI